METICLRTKLSSEQCRHRLDTRVGKARWRWKFSWFGFGPVHECDKPLCGTVDPDGFDFIETGPEGRVGTLPRVHAQWEAEGEHAILRIRPYLTVYQRAIQSLGFAFLGAVLTLPALWILGPMDSATLGCLMAGLSAGCYIFGLGIHARQMRLRGEQLAGKLAVLFEAQPVDPG
jgi:hypothetical protein